MKKDRKQKDRRQQVDLDDLSWRILSIILALVYGVVVLFIDRFFV